MPPGNDRRGANQGRGRGGGGPRGGGQGGRGRAGTPDAGMPPFINAPYNFAPLADRVFVPEWAERISHDVPLREGLSGELRLRLVAESPLLVGGRQREDRQGRTFIEWFRAPDGRCAIPGSSLKGAIRNVLEIATFARMRQIDDVRFGLRDISGPRVKDAYHGVVVGRMRAGLMRRTGRDGAVAEIRPCRLWRIDHADLRAWLERRGVPMPREVPADEPNVLFTAARHRAVKRKYAFWARLAERAGLPDRHTLWVVPPPEGARAGAGPVAGGGPLCRPADRDTPGAREGWLVLTGQVSDRTQREKGTKYKDFVFVEEKDAEAVPVSAEDWRGFLAVHTDAEGEPVAGGGWEYWRKHFDRGEPVPVFWTERLRERGEGDDGDGERRLIIGMAFMPRIACDHSTGDLVGGVCEEHRTEGGPPDFCEGLFGRVGPAPGDCLRGRAVFETLLQTSAHEPYAEAPTILSSPKPTYFPSYLEQPAARAPWWHLPERGHYVTYVDTGADGPPRPRGWKRYPARPDGMVGVQPLDAWQRDNPRVQVVLHPLPRGATFEGRLVFHNLHPVELGGLVWALTWGGEARLRHTLGGGKPFGFGQVRIEVEPAGWLRPNDPGAEPPSLEACLERFRERMDAFCRSAFGRGWLETPQLEALLAMADPDAAPAFLRGVRCRQGTRPPERLAHLRLGRGRNEFVRAKQAGMVLARYAQAARDGGWPGPSHPPPRPAGPDGGRDGTPPAGDEASQARGWVDRAIAEIVEAHHCRPGDALHGRLLAERWAAIEDRALKAAVRAEIRARWQAGGRWDAPAGRAARKARAVYGDDAEWEA